MRQSVEYKVKWGVVVALFVSAAVALVGSLSGG